MTKEATLSVYNTIGWWAIGVGVVVLALSPIVKRWMHLDTLEDRDPTDDLLGQKEVGEPQAPGMRPATQQP